MILKFALDSADTTCILWIELFSLLGGFMPKFLVTMNYVEAKRTSFVIESDNEDDVYEAIGEIDNDFFENHENVKWVCSDYEPPIIDGVETLNKKNEKMVSCSVKQQKAIQKEFDKVIEFFNQAEKK